MFISWYYITGSLFDPYTLFYISAILFNGGLLILQLLPFDYFDLENEYAIFALKLSDYTKLKTSFFISAGLALFHLGALYSLKNLNHKTKQTNGFESSRFYENNDILIVGYFLLVISLLPTVIVFVKSLNIVNEFGYFALYQQEDNIGMKATPLILSNFIVPSMLFILVGYLKKNIHLIISLSLILLYSFIMFYLGYRSQAVLPLIAYVWLWHRYIKKLPYSILISSGVIILFFIFPVVSLTRNLEGIYRLDFNFIVNVFFSIENPIIRIIYEMGSSIITVSNTIDLVPSSRDFELGASYFFAMLTIVPNIWGGLHPSMRYGNPSSWITWAVTPEFAERGGGLGYSFIAEAYLNFGVFGGLLLLGFMGFIVGWISVVSLKTKNLTTILFITSFLAFLLKYARADMYSILRPLVWYCLIPYILIYLFAFFKKKYLSKIYENFINSKSRLV